MHRERGLLGWQRARSGSRVTPHGAVIRFCFVSNALPSVEETENPGTQDLYIVYTPCYSYTHRLHGIRDVFPDIPSHHHVPKIETHQCVFIYTSYKASYCNRETGGRGSTSMYLAYRSSTIQCIRGCIPAIPTAW